MTRDFIAIRDRIENALIAGLDRPATRRQRDAIPRITPTACEFTIGPVTPEIARHAEAVSQSHRRKRQAHAAVAR